MFRYFIRFATLALSHIIPKHKETSEIVVSLGICMTLQRILFPLFLLCLFACDNDPREVYVPLTEPEVELLVSASSVETSVGEPVVLYAERWQRGEWKLVKKRDLTNEDCWMRRPPANHTSEVSDNLRWVALPSSGARFNTNLRSDHTREVVFEKPGTYILESSSKIWCRPEQVAKGKPIRILVSNGNGRTTNRP